MDGFLTPLTTTLLIAAALGIAAILFLAPNIFSPPKTKRRRRLGQDDGAEARVAAAALSVAEQQTLPPADSFRRQEFVLDADASRLFDVLEHAAPRPLRVFPRVALRSIVATADDPSRRTPEQTRLRQRFVDFVICDGETRPLVVVQRLAAVPSPGQAVQEPDRLLQAALAGAALPVMYADPTTELDVEHWRAEIATALAKDLNLTSKPAST
ncbi:MAG: hypothetical protein C0483_16845 [Pirellula sp.]|nr:hypothetical protein [Pirellula sp.]